MISINGKNHLLLNGFVSGANLVVSIWLFLDYFDIMVIRKYNGIMVKLSILNLEIMWMILEHFLYQQNRLVLITNIDTFYEIVMNTDTLME